MQRILCFLLFAFLGSFLFADSGDKKELVCVFKLEGEIMQAQADFVDRAVRMASSRGAKYLIVDMNTPGGSVDSTLEIMDSLKSFKGETICFVNTDAISAGSFIATACNKIYFSPRGVMGAAEAVSATGGDIGESMQRKISSFISAKVRAFVEDDKSRRAQVQRAMNDPNFELKIGKRIIKPKGELLTLTAKEAAEIIEGSPLLSDGTIENLDALLKKIAPKAVVENIDKTWADKCAMFAQSISALVFGLTIFLVVMDIKSGGLGLLSLIGIGLSALVFLGINMAGLAGYEEILVFIAGALLLLAEVIFFPGLVIPSLIGIMLMLGGAVWILGGGWFERGLDYNISAINEGIFRLGISVVFACVLILLLGRFFPRLPILSRLVLKPCSDGNADSKGAAQVLSEGGKYPLVSDVGICITDLTPSGRADFNGRIVEVVSDFGTISRGDKVEIISKKDFNFKVKKV